MHFDFLIPVFYTDDDIDYYDLIAERLQRKGCSVAFVTHLKYGYEKLRNKYDHVYFLYDTFDPAVPVTAEEMNELEQKYGFGSMHDHVFPEEQFPAAQRHEDLLRRAVYIFRWVERFLEKHTVSMFVNNVGPELIRRCFSRIAAAGGPINLIMDFAPIRGRIALTTSDFTWDELPAQLPELTSDERAEMQRFAERVRTEQRMFTKPSPLNIGPKNFANAARLLLRSQREPRLDYRLEKVFAERAMRLVRRAVNPRFYHQPTPGEKYLFFPLHLADDSAITIRAPQFQRQEFLAAYIAERALPAGTKLYVKPHLGAMESYSVEMIAKLSRIPNVKLIAPQTNSHALIRGAEGVVVINSTVGWESLFYRKPVVVLGRVFYRGHGVTTDVENLTDLRDAVKHALAHPPDEERILRFFHACHKATQPGVLYLRTEENLQNLATGLIEKARRLGIVLGSPARRSQTNLTASA
jgi:capsular polysaccharide export protein